MNRDELIKEIGARGHHTNEARDIADFILENFDPKQPATERVSAKEVFLQMNASEEWFDYTFDHMVKLAHEAAECFNNYRNEEEN